LNVALRRSPLGPPAFGETAEFVTGLDNDRLLLRYRGEEVVAGVAAGLQGGSLNPGDVVRYGSDARMAFERVQGQNGRQYLLKEVPDLGPEVVGGQDEVLATLLSVLTAALVNPARAARYAIDGRNTVFMSGPPGCGKTLMAQVAASRIVRNTGRKCRFAVVKPGEWEAAYVGETQRNIRNFFSAVNEAAQDGYVVVFLDEVEAIGRTRGGAVGHHSDKFLACLLAEINGFRDRANVAIIAASNRPDLIDSALLDRLSDIRLCVRRPDARGARCIFQIHLPPTLPFSPNGEMAGHTHQEIIDAAVSRLYSPNGDNAICRIRFRDAKERLVNARHLVSGRLIEQICRSACRAAFQREANGGGEDGLRLTDMLDALSAAMERLRSTLTPYNARAYLDDLPQDVDVVAVEPVTRRVAAPHRYLNLDAA
jgi:SpoVK/Ycf46/Vps4 family AAA+-type ATPase